MDRKYLIESAQKLKKPDLAAAQEYSGAMDVLIAQINERMAARQDIEELIGPRNLEMMRDNHGNHARFMDSMFYCYNPEVLIDTVLWVFRAYRSHGFRLTYWPAQLNTWIELMKSTLSSETFSQIYPFYHWMLVNQATFVKLSDGIIQADAPHPH